MGFSIASPDTCGNNSAHGQAWNDWYHVTVHTYGSWLRGDPRGWRARHHREHVDGDYKNPPPPGKYDKLFALSQALMKRDPVRIERELRRFVVEAIVEKLREDGIEVPIASVDGYHLHILARFPDHDVRHWVGRAKKHASHLVRQCGLRTDKGGPWAKRCHPEPIEDRDHQPNTFGYIYMHARRGGDGTPLESTASSGRVQHISRTVLPATEQSHGEGVSEGGRSHCDCALNLPL